MIRCVKCGKLYDYKKYDGICPNCARYNRPDSSELEQDLHERYDSTPNIHSAQAHEEAHRRNYDSSAHYTNNDGAQQYYEYNMNGDTRKKPSVGKVVMIIVVIIIVIAIIGAVATSFMVVKNAFGGYDDYDTQDDIFIEEETGDVYVEYGWTSVAGPVLDEIDWDETTLSLTDEEKQAFLEQENARADEEPGCYYTMTLEIQNNSDEDLDLTDVTKEDVTIYMDDTQVECRLVSTLYYDEIEADDYGYVDCVIFLTDEILQPYIDDYTECEVNGYIDVGKEQLTDTDNRIEFSFEEYYYEYSYEWEDEDSNI